MVNIQLNPIEMIILDYLNKIEKEISMLELSKKIGKSYPTVMKYVGTLELKNKIKITDFGNRRMVSRI